MGHYVYGQSGSRAVQPKACLNIRSAKYVAKIYQPHNEIVETPVVLE